MAAEPPPVPAAPADWGRFRRPPGLVYGFHGCDRALADEVLAGRQQLNPSVNTYDWLGSGTYFWESDPWRAWRFAHEAKHRLHLTRGRIQTPYVLGAIINLGHCCNLLEAHALQEVQEAYDYLEGVQRTAGQGPMPRNKGEGLGQRFLDRAVIETMHQLRERRGLPKYDTVRSPFREGKLLYEGAGFQALNHMQIAVRSDECVVAYFRLPGL